MAGGACLPRHQGKGDAEYPRGHREVFERALEWGCTPNEALRRMRREELKRERERWFAGRADRHAAVPAGDPRSGHDDTPQDTQQWWEKD